MTGTAPINAVCCGQGRSGKKGCGPRKLAVKIRVRATMSCRCRARPKLAPVGTRLPHDAGQKSPFRNFGPVSGAILVHFPCSTGSKTASNPITKAHESIRQKTDPCSTYLRSALISPKNMTLIRRHNWRPAWVTSMRACRGW